MSLRGWLVLGVVLGLIGWWNSPVSPRGAEAPALAMGATVACQLPPRVAAFNPPLQSDAPTSMAPFRLEAATLTPLAGLSVDARVLSRKDYSFGRESELSPTDLALGWGRMRDDAVLSRLEISQSGRWFNYRYEGEAPLPQQEIDRSASNMHLIPGDAAVAERLRGVRAGDRVRIDGWLVEAQAADGWRWRSSTSRDDTGQGACELIYVCGLTRL